MAKHRNYAILILICLPPKLQSHIQVLYHSLTEGYRGKKKKLNCCSDDGSYVSKFNPPIGLRLLTLRLFPEFLKEAINY